MAFHEIELSWMGVLVKDPASDITRRIIYANPVAGEVKSI